MNIPSPKSYVIQAIYRWAVDFELTPCLLFLKPQDIVIEGIPREVIPTDGHLMLNVSPFAAHHLEIGKEFLSCGMRFGSYVTDIKIAIDDIDGFLIRETQEYISLAAVTDDEATRFKRNANYRLYLQEQEMQESEASSEAEDGTPPREPSPRKSSPDSRFKIIK